MRSTARNGGPGRTSIVTILATSLLAAPAIAQRPDTDTPSSQPTRAPSTVPLAPGVRASDRLVGAIAGPSSMARRLRATNVGAAATFLRGDDVWDELAIETARLVGQAFAPRGRQPGVRTHALVIDWVRDSLLAAESLSFSSDTLSWPGRSRSRSDDGHASAMLALTTRTPADADALAARAAAIVDELDVEVATTAATDRLPALHFASNRPFEVLLPVAIGPHVVFGFATDGALLQQRLHETIEAPQQVLPPALRGSIVGLRVVPDRCEDEDLARASGWPCIRDFRFSVAPDGPYLAIEFSAGLEPDRVSGWLASFFAADPVDSDVVTRGVPESVSSWVAFHIDPGAWHEGLLRTVTAMFNGFLFSSRRPFEEALADNREQARRFWLGDPHERYFRHLTGDWLLGLVPRTRLGPDERNVPNTTFENVVLVGGVHEPSHEAFARGFGEFWHMRARELDVLGPRGGESLAYLLGDRLIVSLGPNAGQLARDFETVAHWRGGSGARPVPGAGDDSERSSAAQRARIDAPSHAMAVGSFDTTRLWRAIPFEILPGAHRARDLLRDEIVPALAERHLDRIGLHAARSADGRRWRVRARW